VVDAVQDLRQPMSAVCRRRETLFWGGHSIGPDRRGPESYHVVEVDKMCP
jgi:hypothetical protein